MANRFEQYVNKPTGEKEPPKENRFSKFKAPDAPPDPVMDEFGRDPNDPWYERAGRFGLDTLRSFNDGLTFGLYDKALQATGVDPNAVVKTEVAKNVNPVAGIIGETAGMAVPGFGISSGLAKALPKLGANTYRAIAANQGLTSGLLSATDDVARTGTIDPYGVSIDTASGAILGPVVAAGSRFLSPAARVRAFGSDLSGADKQAAFDFSRRARLDGVPLTNAEAVAATTTKGQDVVAAMDLAASSPKGSRVLAEFNANRQPSIAQVGKDIVSDVGPGLTPDKAAEAAKRAIGRNEELVQSSAQPFYDIADAKKLPPSWIPKKPSIGEARNAVLANSEKMADLTAEYKATHPGHTGPLPENSFLFTDAVKKQLGTMIDQAEKGSDNYLKDIRVRAAKGLTDRMDTVSPDYATARDITAQGKDMVDRLSQGPLGQIMNNPGNVSAQSNALFNPGTQVEKNIADNAIRHLGAVEPNAPRGILANQIDAAVTRNPLTFGREVLPNDYAQELAESVIGQRYGEIAGKLGAARAVKNVPGPQHNNENSPIGQLWASIRDYGRGGVTRLMLDPEWIKKMGGVGPAQRAITQALQAVEINASNNQGV